MTEKKHYSKIMDQMQEALEFDSDLIAFASHEFDIELGKLTTRVVLSAMIGGEEVSIEPDDPKM